MRIQPDKVCWMLVTLRHIDRNQIALYYAGKMVRQELEITYLGVVIDSRLNMIGHINNNIRKARKALGVVRYATCQQVTLNSLVNLVRATILSKLEYGLHVCCPISDAQFDRMDMILNQALKIISGATQKTSGEALRFYLGFHSLKQIYKIKSAKELVRAATTESHPLYDELREATSIRIEPRLKIVKPWSTASLDIVEHISPISTIVKNIWVPYNNNRIVVDIIGSREWRDRSPIINQSEVEAFIETINANIIIATDGSVRENVTAWAGLVWRKKKCIYRWSAAKHGRTSSFRAESEGVEDALFWMSANTSISDSVLLLTDSRSLITRLQCGMVKDSWVEALSNIKSSLRFVYIPGHAGITYNEAADHLASSAWPMGEIHYHPSDIANRLKLEISNEKSHSKTWWSLSRLKENGIDFGDGARRLTRGKETRLITQKDMGTITINTLKDILEKGWPGAIATIV